MKIVTIDLKEDNTAAASLAVDALRKGGSVVFPTDTVYGLAANGTDHHIAKQIFRIKKRSHDKALPVLVRNMKWAKEVAFIPPQLEPILEKLWPGPITAVFPKKSIIPSMVTAGKESVALRIADSKLVDTILGQFGYPLATTSANISSDLGSNDSNLVIKAFEKEVFKPDLIIDAGKLPSAVPSTIIDFTGIEPKILRVGVAKPKELMELLGIEL